jgi:hypothetical protein
MNRMSVDQALGQARPILSLIGSIIIAVGLAVFWFGLGINVPGSGLEFAASGFLLKHF